MGKQRKQNRAQHGFVEKDEEVHWNAPTLPPLYPEEIDETPAQTLTRLVLNDMHLEMTEFLAGMDPEEYAEVANRAFTGIDQKSYNSMIEFAVRNAAYPFLKNLLKGGIADPNIPMCNGGLRPVEFIINNRSEEMLRIMLSYPEVNLGRALDIATINGDCDGKIVLIRARMKRDADREAAV